MNPNKLKQFEKYYYNLYSQPTSVGEEHLTEIIDNLDLPTIGSKPNAILTAEITIKEIAEAIKSGKSTGADGMGASFYKRSRKSKSHYSRTRFTTV